MKMAFSYLCVAFGVLAVVAAEPAMAQEPTAKVGMTVQSIRGKPHPSRTGTDLDKADFVSLDVSAKVQVYNGTPADGKDWPATMVSRPSGCTATMIGPRVMLTAAHCVENGASVMFFIAGRTRTATCTHHEKYTAAYDNAPTGANWAATSADYAVCVVPEADRVSGVLLEVVGAGPLFGNGETVRLLGFGCNGTTIDSDGYGTLRTAAAGIEALPAAPNNYFVTDWSKGGFGHAKGGVVCPGDSGGAVYWPVSGVRRIVALNSRTGVTGDGRTLIGKSYLSSVLTESANQFLGRFSTAENGGICGLRAGVEGCRQ